MKLIVTCVFVLPIKLFLASLALLLGELGHGEVGSFCLLLRTVKTCRSDLCWLSHSDAVSFFTSDQISSRSAHAVISNELRIFEMFKNETEYW